MGFFRAHNIVTDANEEDSVGEWAQHRR
jgi:hypothetical protein